jgi:hypothetical protein
MRLPNAENAVVDIIKLTDYCLNPIHPRGRHKARVFVSVLGINASGAALLRTFLLRAAREGDAVEAEKDMYGQRYQIDFEMAGLDGVAVIRSIWIIIDGENNPKLISCYVK